jgi:signal transduction histidine kinase
VHALVRDDGKGFDPTAKTDGFGLLGMRERTAILGGELDVDSTPAGGTVVRARIPTLRREAAAGPAAATA